MSQRSGRGRRGTGLIMGKGLQIICDGCGIGIAYTRNCVGYRLALKVESRAKHPEVRVFTMMGVFPPLERDHHFCNLSCLGHWIDRRRYLDNLWHDWWGQWRELHGRRDATGKLGSYPAPDSEVTASKKAEFEAAALRAYPMRKARSEQCPK
jgi:hypothetical protein